METWNNGKGEWITEYVEYLEYDSKGNTISYMGSLPGKANGQWVNDW